MKINLLLLLSFWFCFITCYSPSSLQSMKQKKLALVYQQNFDTSNAIDDFGFTDPKAWQHAADGSLECIGNSDYAPPFRSPVNIGLISDKQFGSFILEVDLQQTGRVYNHQDLCIFFGFQNPDAFYYAHISKAMDDHANQIFIVNKAARTKISTKTNNGQNWQVNQWHHIKLIRNTQTGLIQLFFEDMETPVMEAVDTTFGFGGLGFGTFDDSGKIDNIQIWASGVGEKDEDYFN